jgi:pimeloyl-ACP methyl ester carboxylesterase
MRTRMMELKRKSRDELLAGQRAEMPGWSEAELGPWADAKLRVSPYVANLFGSRPATAVDWSETLRRITSPALLITGDSEQGAIVTEENAAALRELVPHLRIAHVPGSGHSIRRDQPARYLDVVRGYLAEWAAAG